MQPSREASVALPFCGTRKHLSEESKPSIRRTTATHDAAKRSTSSPHDARTGEMEDLDALRNRYHRQCFKVFNDLRGYVSKFSSEVETHNSGGDINPHDEEETRATVHAPLLQDLVPLMHRISAHQARLDPLAPSLSARSLASRCADLARTSALNTFETVVHNYRLKRYIDGCVPGTRQEVAGADAAPHLVTVFCHRCGAGPHHVATEPKNVGSEDALATVDRLAARRATLACSNCSTRLVMPRSDFSDNALMCDFRAHAVRRTRFLVEKKLQLIKDVAAWLVDAARARSSDGGSLHRPSPPAPDSSHGSAKGGAASWDALSASGRRSTSSVGAGPRGTEGVATPGAARRRQSHGSVTVGGPITRVGSSSSGGLARLPRAVFRVAPLVQLADARAPDVATSDSSPQLGVTGSAMRAPRPVIL